VSPGYAPFAGALRMPAWLCDNCGFWQRYFATPPSCPLCLDARHVVPQDAWRFWTLAQAQSRFPMHAAELEPGVWRYWNDPICGIGANAYVVDGVAFEGGGVWSEEALAHVEARGGLRVIAASHPHSYGALWQLQERFPDAELALHPGDLAWTNALQVSLPFDDVLEVGDGLTLHHTGGHFAGHAVLHDARRRILLCGDALKFEMASARKAAAISTHKAFVRGVPMTPGELRRYREVFAQLDFVQTWTPFEQAANSGRDEALALIDRLLATRSTAAPVALEELR
jgi:hypothetical protein